MAEVAEISIIIRTLPALISALEQNMIFLHYDNEANVLYVNFSATPVEADDSELLDGDIIIRYREGRIIGVTMLNALPEFS